MVGMLGLFAGCVEIDIMSNGALEYKEYNEQVFENMANFYLSNSNGSVVIEPSTDGKIKVQSVKVITGATEERLREIAGYLTIRYERSGSTFNVETHYPMPRPAGVASMRIDYRLYIPVNTKIEVKTTNGSIQVNGMHNSVQLQSSNGSLTISNHRGYLEAQTTNGSIEVVNSEGEVDLQSSNGRIEVDTNKVVHQADLETSNSSILFKARLDRRGNYELNSSNGSMEIWVEKSLSYDLYAKTSNGRVQFTFPMQFSGIFEKNYIDGKLFNGSDIQLRAKTSNGNIIFMAWEDKR
jgi:hypothetical protein